MEEELDTKIKLRTLKEIKIEKEQKNKKIR